MASCKYSCSTTSETLEWIRAIVEFLSCYSFLMNAHVVNFFKDRLWEDIDEEWISCLRKEKPENLLLIPSGVGQDHWPASLKEFVHTMKSLSFPREQVDLQLVLPDVHMTPLNCVLSQGMNLKKKHEVEVLSAVVSSVVNNAGAHTVVDVGSGQGYLAQVLSFQYKHSVVAVDASFHHGKVTDARAARIKKHFAAQMLKSGSGNKSPDVPMTITCRVLSTDMLKALTDVPLLKGETELKVSELDEDYQRSQSSINANRKCSVVLAGLHACGDLSVTMLRTFLEYKEAKAVVSIGCCYNLLSEESSENSCSCYGFPMSAGLKSTGLSLGKSSRDLACQSAERWSSLGQEAGLHNFDLHAFRAAFQMDVFNFISLNPRACHISPSRSPSQEIVLSKYYPEVMATNPTIGRQGKAFRRQQQRKVRKPLAKVDGRLSITELLAAPREDGFSGQALDVDELSSITNSGKETISESDKFSSFQKFCTSAFSRLNVVSSHDIDLPGVWKEAEAYSELIGPYWSIRAALGPVLETLILLDRLLFLQEQGSSIESVMLPIFNPTISPRNVAIIAKRV